MPIVPTYPGVYVQELSSGVRTITGVATSITAFVGRTERGSTNEPVILNNYGDFERLFGSLTVQSTLSFAVRDFYLNGGQQAIVVRLFHEKGGVAANAPLTIGTLQLEAANPGAWGANLRGFVDNDHITDADSFNLTLRDESTGTTERYLNLTVKDTARRIDRVLKAQSALARWKGAWNSPAHPAADATDAVTKDQRALVTAQNALQDALRAGGDTTSAKTAVSKANDDLTKAISDANAAVSDGDALTFADFFPANGLSDKKGLYALEQADLFNLLCIPPYKDSGDGINFDTEVPVISAAAAYCEKRRAMLLVDPPSAWTSKATAKTQFTDANTDNVGTRSKNAALFFPRLSQPNPLKDNQIEHFVPCGAVAGIFANTDTQRGIWKAPAGQDATLVGVPQLAVPLTDDENGELNPLGVNCLRSFPIIGRVVWGARTLAGADALANEYKYIPVRRTALYIEESLYRGLKWVVFEPNDEPLWAQIRLNVGAFMNNLFRQGAFQGRTPAEAYFVKCDKETTTQNDINLGIVNVVVGFAPLKPAEFVIITVQQIAGQIVV